MTTELQRHDGRSVYWRTVMWSGLAATLLGSLGCGSDSTAPGLTNPQLYWQLTLNHHAITLATVSPYDTLRLIATPRTLSGTPLTATTRPIFAVNDTMITIDSTGLVRVHGTLTKPNIVVTAQLTVGKVTLTDTAYVNVVEQPSAAAVPMMDSLTLVPVAGDSAIRAAITTAAKVASQTFATPLVKTKTGDSIPNTVVRFTSANPSIAYFASPTIGTVTPVVTGRVLLTAEATVYGKSLTDSLWYTIGWPLETIVRYGGLLTTYINPPALPNVFQQGANAVIGQGGVVVWANNTWGLPDDSLDVQFDDTIGVEGLQKTTKIRIVSNSIGQNINFPPDVGGNIPPFSTITFGPYPGFSGDVLIDGLTNLRVRTFPNAGVYRWHSQRQGITGQIRVVPNDSVQ